MEEGSLGLGLNLLQDEYIAHIKEEIENKGFVLSSWMKLHVGLRLDLYGH